MANSKMWSFLINSFLIATEGSYRIAVRISTYHFSALTKRAGEPFFDALILVFTPLHQNLLTAYEKWKSQGGNQQGKTLRLKNLLSMLSSIKIREWDIKVQPVFDILSDEYKELLPNKRTPFQNGSQEDKISSVAAFASALEGKPPFADLKKDVDEFLLLLKTALVSQKGEISGTKTNSDEVEAARKAMCVGQYANLGALMQQFAANPANINQYFDLTAIRSGAQVLFTGETKPGKTDNIFKRTFKPAEKMLLRNEGNTELKFYLAEQKKDAPVKPITLAAGAQQTITATDLEPLSNKFFNVQNTDDINIGEWTVEFV